MLNCVGKKPSCMIQLSLKTSVPKLGSLVPRSKGLVRRHSCLHSLLNTWLHPLSSLLYSSLSLSFFLLSSALLQIHRHLDMATPSQLFMLIQQPTLSLQTLTSSNLPLFSDPTFLTSPSLQGNRHQSIKLLHSSPFSPSPTSFIPFTFLNTFHISSMYLYKCLLFVFNAKF